MTTPELRTAVYDAMSKYNDRLDEIERTMQGFPRPEILQAIHEAGADTGACVPFGELEQWARRVSEGLPMTEPPLEDDDPC